MQIIFSRKAADEIKQRYLVLELEEFDPLGDGRKLETFCVVPAEKIAFSDISQIEQSKKLHNDFVAALKLKDYPRCQDLYPQVVGLFGGELDSFYEEILKRINLEQI